MRRDDWGVRKKGLSEVRKSKWHSRRTWKKEVNILELVRVSE